MPNPHRIHLEVGADTAGVVTACGPPDDIDELVVTTLIPSETTCPQCRRNPMYNFKLPIALRREARRFA